MDNIELKIEGMECTGCSNRLEKILNSLDGVDTARVNFDNAVATISFDKSKITSEKIKDTIIEAGFNIAL